MNAIVKVCLVGKFLAKITCKVDVASSEQRFKKGVITIG